MRPIFGSGLMHLFGLCKSLANLGPLKSKVSGVGAGPTFLRCLTITPCGAQGFVSGHCYRAVLFPWSAVLRGRFDCGVTAAGDLGAIGFHDADFFVLGDLAQ
jgi:hypothetical protein